jgi:hypothetical protein
MWRAVTLELQLAHPGAADRATSFMQWLLPRAPGVHSLTVAGRFGGEAGAPAPPGADVVWADVVGAMAAAGPHLRELVVEWEGELVLSGWVAAMHALRAASFSAHGVVVRGGLAQLANLRDLRFKSLPRPLRFAAAPAAAPAPPPAPDAGASPPASPRAAPPLLPPGLRALRMDGCGLTALPPGVAALRRLTDLVLSNNLLGAGDLTPLSRMTALRQLTLMGTRMARLPPALSALAALRVLYLDGVLQPGAGDAPPHAQVAAALGPLRRLGVLSLGSSRLGEFPVALEGMTSLRALYLDNNPALAALPDGPYLRRLLVLGLDWRVLFASHAVLRGAPLLRKLCLTSFRGVADGARSAADGDAVAAALAAHPALRQVLLPMVDGDDPPLFLAPLNVALRLAASPRVDVRAVTYGGISNEWAEWLDEANAAEAGGA